jgi:hypothetical protein
MAKTPRLSYYAANKAADAVVDELNTGLLKIYTGTQPASCNSAAWATHVLLATITFNATAFGDSTAGVASANAFTADSAADTAGTATWFRCFMAAGNTAMFDGNIGRTSADFNIALNAVAVQAGAEVTLTSFTYTQPRS